MATTPTTTTIAADPYNVALSIYRNRAWIQYFKVSELGVPLDLSADELALIVLSGAAVVLSNSVPLVGSGDGSVSFVYTDGETESLTANGRYVWQFLRRPAG